VEVNLCGF
jgi:translation initiation factor 3 subunit I